MKTYKITYNSGHTNEVRAYNILMVLAMEYYNVNIITKVEEVTS